MCKVMHIKRPFVGDVVYIGRPSKWGNPFVVGVHGSRSEVIAKYIALKENDAEFIAEAKRELKGKNLGCYCAPQACHGDWLLKIANED